ncbi:hypothetical protein [Halocola ammonii]
MNKKKLQVKSPSQYVVLTVIIQLVIFVTLLQIEKGFLPDIAGLQRLKPIDLFGLICSIVSSIVGIIVAVVLIAFEYDGNNFHRRERDSILNDWKAMTFFSFSISLVLVSFVAYSYVHDFGSSQRLTIGYFVLFQFVVFIILLVPVISSTLKSADRLKKTIGLIQSVEWEDIEGFETTRHKNFISHTTNNKIVAIRTDLNYYVQKEDSDAYNQVMEELNSLAVDYIDNGLDREDSGKLFHALVFIWRHSIQKAYQNSSNDFLNAIWISIETFYEKASVSQVELTKFEVLKDFKRNFLQSLNARRFDEALIKGVSVIAESFKRNFQLNSPAENRILQTRLVFNNTIENNSKDNAQWMELNQILRELGLILNSSVISGNLELNEEARYNLLFIAISMRYNQNEELSPKEGLIVIGVYMYLKNNALNALRKGLYSFAYECMPIDMFLFQKIIKSRREIYRNVLSTVSRFILTCQAEGFLSSSDGHSLISTWATIGRQCSNQYSSDENIRSVFKFVIDTLVALKSQVERTDLIEQGGIYKLIKSELESLRTWLLNDNLNIKESDVINTLNDVIQSFKDIKPQEHTYEVKWD